MVKILQKKKKKMENTTTYFNEKREGGYMGSAVHSQVIKIKQEIEKTKHPSLQLHIRRALRRDVNRLRSRSPLGLAESVILGC
ncbi:unnamed protein product [Sphenostylis stenocarpa]|uniref:Uncharacterized protein n=1 Tax=Sphenostylis stenocarpa TaxID=92480 RepID=A0AA86RZV4_9FABA|nr:unnamed protein product [Sphenostylis stenocarpa]